ncbi:Sigma-54 dependent transcriptional regulator [Marinobacterium lacunae]|uniref:Sigma-54 dependent transcriptional regulator n=1 Tax=Marinobacterium lacunae TaxID=1232683 RepID=A0A081G3B1_9GAMM|nr:sigma-54 dependent transcriptional regulator [Marinobacterium lacunae]KEA65266.1 Sigma-54 dependent transcriptional regulator [Marinobacterium lacunae]
MATPHWLAQAANLLEHRRRETLLQDFLQTLSDALTLDSVLFLVCGVDGRELSVEAGLGALARQAESGLQLKVSDFRHPFAHLLQSGEPMLLSKEKLAYWQDHDRFASLSQCVDTEQALLLYPLALHEQVGGILCMKLRREQSHAVLSSTEWQQYSAVFVRHWITLQQLSKQRGYGASLSASITEMEQQRQQESDLASLGGILVGRSEHMQNLRLGVLRVAGSKLSVLIQGETGTGKELVARAVHDFSDRRDKPFVAINCAAIPESLLESELFGYSKGAFSGADRSKKGLVAQAHKGTLFLDEIGDMPVSLQSKLLRVLETGRYRALGALSEEYSDFRLVAATHVNLKSEIETGAFRRDLFYRLCQFPLRIPALCERAEDIPELVACFIEQFNCTHHRAIPGIRFNALSTLRRHRFQGNVRELRNMLEYACALTADGVEISSESLPAVETDSVEPQAKTESAEKFAKISDLKSAVAQFEREVIRSRLRVFKGDRSRAAMSLGLPKRTFSHKCQKLEVED